MHLYISISSIGILSFFDPSGYYTQDPPTSWLAVNPAADSIQFILAAMVFVLFSGWNKLWRKKLRARRQRRRRKREEKERRERGGGGEGDDEAMMMQRRRRRRRGSEQSGGGGEDGERSGRRNFRTLSSSARSHGSSSSLGGSSRGEAYPLRGVSSSFSFSSGSRVHSSSHSTNLNGRRAGSFRNPSRPGMMVGAAGRRRSSRYRHGSTSAYSGGREHSYRYQNRTFSSSRRSGMHPQPLGVIASARGSYVLQRERSGERSLRSTEKEKDHRRQSSRGRQLRGKKDRKIEGRALGVKDGGGGEEEEEEGEDMIKRKEGEGEAPRAAVSALYNYQKREEGSGGGRDQQTPSDARHSKQEEEERRRKVGTSGMAVELGETEADSRRDTDQSYQPLQDVIVQVITSPSSSSAAAGAAAAAPSDGKKAGSRDRRIGEKTTGEVDVQAWVRQKRKQQQQQQQQQRQLQLERERNLLMAAAESVVAGYSEDADSIYSSNSQWILANNNNNNNNSSIRSGSTGSQALLPRLADSGGGEEGGLETTMTNNTDHQKQGVAGTLGTLKRHRSRVKMMSRRQSSYGSTYREFGMGLMVNEDEGTAAGALDGPSPPNNNNNNNNNNSESNSGNVLMSFVSAPREQNHHQQQQTRRHICSRQPSLLRNLSVLSISESDAPSAGSDGLLY